MARKTYVRDANTGKFVEKHLRTDEQPGGRKQVTAMLNSEFEPFVSPVDNSVINGPKALRDHNRRNNVVDAREFPPEYYAKKEKERHSEMYGEKAKQARRAAINETIERFKSQR